MRHLGVCCAIGAAFIATACAGNDSLDDLKIGQVSAAVSTAYEVSSAATCGALPTPGTWSGNTCTVSSDLALGSGDTLTVASGARLNIATGTTLRNSGGTVNVVFGASYTGGNLENTSGGSITIAGFSNLGGTVHNDAASSIQNTNQFFWGFGTFTNQGSFVNSGTVSGGNLVNSGSFENSGSYQGAVDNSGTTDNTGKIDVGCAAFSNTGTFNGNAPVLQTCWTGFSGAWSDASHWNRGRPPVSGEEVTINNGQPTIDVDLTLNNAVVMNLSSLTIGSGVTVSNVGTIRIGMGGQPPNSTRLVNSGTFVNQGTIDNNDRILNNGTFTNQGSIVNSTVVGTVENTGTFVNSAGHSIPCGLLNQSSGHFENDGTVDLNSLSNTNYGTVVNAAGAVLNVNNQLQNDAPAVLENHGTIHVTHNLTRPGGIVNQAGARIVNESGAEIDVVASDAFITNQGAFGNFGSCSNGGAIDNTGTICGNAVSGNAVTSNAPIASCSPVADAGPDISIGEGSPVVLDGRASTDPMGGSLTFSWAQVSGPSVALSVANPKQPSFEAPYVSENVTLTFSLVVSNGSESSAPAVVNVTVKQTNNPPVADAGDDTSVKEGALATLDASHAYDPDGDIIVSYLWEQVAGPAVILSPSARVPSPNFIAPRGVGTTLVFKLVVSDGKEPSVPSSGTDSAAVDTVAVTIVANSRPVAVTGNDITRNEGSTVTLDATGSFDPDASDSITYSWIQTSGPSVVLDNPSSPTPAFVAPFVNEGGATITFQLTVTDNDPVNPLSSAPDDVTVHILNINDPPRCALAQPSVSELWPPDHKLTVVQIAGITDDQTPASSVLIRVVSVTQDEHVDDPSGDAVIVSGNPSDSVLLRASRDATLNGRVYRVTFSASDGFEACLGSVSVGVPRDRKSGSVDDGQSFESIAP